MTQPTHSEGHSKTLKDMHRPAFIQMCRDIKDGKIDAIIATELARLNRNTRDFLQFWEFLKQKNVKMFVLKQNFDTSTPGGEMMLTTMAAFAQFERETIVGRIKDGARARAERGLGNGGPGALGFDADPEHPCRVVINEKEKPYVEMIFRKFIELGTLAKLQDYLNEKGYRTKSHISKKGQQRGGKVWTSGTLHGTLTNLAYLGKREFHKKNRGRNPEHIKPEDRYRILDGHWPALISEKLFADVQEILENNKSEARPYVHHYRLKRLVTCGVCNSQLIGKTSTGNGGRYFYYGHMRKQLSQGTRHLEKCPVENISAPALEEIVIERLCELAQDRKLVESLAKSAVGESKSLAEQNKALLRSEEDQLSAIKAQIDGLLSAVSVATTDAAKRFTFQKIEDLGVQSEAFTMNIEEMKKRSNDNVIDLDKVFRLLRGFNKSFRQRPAHQQRDIIRDVVKGIVITGPGTAKISYYISPREEELFPGVSFFTDEFAEPTHHRSVVRSALRMVGSTGVEPATPTVSR
jgi:site-specific DNA recombinase